MAEAPDWWKNLTDDGRETYIRTHPNSKMAKLLNAEARERIAKTHEERAKLRSRIRKIGNDPQKVLKEDFEKFDNPKLQPSKKQEAEIDRSIRQSKRGNTKAILKGIGVALAVAGVATIGGAMLASGGLPYAIITYRLIRDTKDVAKQIHQKIKDGHPQLQAVLSSVKDVVSKTLTDPKMVAAALVLSQNKQPREKQKVISPSGKKTDVKTQEVAPKKKKHNSDAITELAPKPKPKVKPAKVK